MICANILTNFNEGNILKYLLRDKGEDVSDMGKIIDYATREKEHLVKTGLNKWLGMFIMLRTLLIQVTHSHHNQ